MHALPLGTRKSWFTNGNPTRYTQYSHVGWAQWKGWGGPTCRTWGKDEGLQKPRGKWKGLSLDFEEWRLGLDGMSEQLQLVSALHTYPWVLLLLLLSTVSIMDEIGFMLHAWLCIVCLYFLVVKATLLYFTLLMCLLPMTYSTFQLNKLFSLDPP